MADSDIAVSRLRRVAARQVKRLIVVVRVELNDEWEGPRRSATPAEPPPRRFSDHNTFSTSTRQPLSQM